MQRFLESLEHSVRSCQPSELACAMKGTAEPILDIAEAIDFTGKAAEQGDAIAQRNLGVMRSRRRRHRPRSPKRNGWRVRG